MKQQELQIINQIIEGMKSNTYDLINTLEEKLGEEITAEEFKSFFFKSAHTYLHKCEVKGVNFTPAETPVQVEITEEQSKEIADLEKSANALQESLQTKKILICEKKGCNEPILADGLCKFHYSAKCVINKVKEQEPKVEVIDATVVKEHNECSVENCNKSSVKDGLCMKHFFEKRDTVSEVSKDEKKPTKKSTKVSQSKIVKAKNNEKPAIQKGKGNVVAKDVKKCSVDGCTNQYYAKGFCAKHYKIEWKKNKKK